MTVDEWLERTNLPRFRRRLLAWYRRHGRRLPWRETNDPYAIWVSEIMLQQTQVATVLGYYRRFLERFPTLADLAAAGEQDVLLYWQGLGYYRRCRHLHAAARRLVAQGKTQLPTDPAELIQLPGFGQYCANAVATFSHDAQVAILEANTIRLWTRLLADPRDPTQMAARRDLWRIAEAILPRRRPGEFNQALMDLGAVVCGKNPQCDACPVRSDCTARAMDLQTEFPRLKPKSPMATVDHVSVIVRWRGRFLLRQRVTDAVWGGMWEFPHAEVAEGEDPLATACRILAPWKSLWIASPRLRLRIDHAVMRSRITLHAFDIALRRRPNSTRPIGSSTVWALPGQLANYPMASPQRRIAAHLERYGVSTSD